MKTEGMNCNWGGKRRVLSNSILTADCLGLPVEQRSVIYVRGDAARDRHDYDDRESKENSLLATSNPWYLKQLIFHHWTSQMRLEMTLLPESAMS